MSRTLQIGLVEDDPTQAKIIATMIQNAGMDCLHYATELDFRRRMGPESIDLLLLDWNLPGVSGLELLKELRQSNATLPVIFLTGNDQEEDIVTGLQAGADDYIVKPARAAELVARINAALRRAAPPSQMHMIDGVEPFGFDLERRRLTLHGEPVELTDREFDLLVFLFQRRGKVVSRETLLSQVWRVGPNVATRSVDTYVSRLRKRLGLQGDSEWRLEGIYQHGYRLVRTSSDEADEVPASAG
ncbi:response regulator transcription factor [Silanimonas lenta]|uniref:response regulator transcription factor n=1 Tax=Silanimonas lenta TaxID=265429 RepID=UPI000420FAE5|nr:response regulator transcription factor [Silanimonas lenta]